MRIVLKEFIQNTGMVIFCVVQNQVYLAAHRGYAHQELVKCDGIVLIGDAGSHDTAVWIYGTENPDTFPGGFLEHHWIMILGRYPHHIPCAMLVEMALIKLHEACFRGYKVKDFFYNCLSYPDRLCRS